MVALKEHRQEFLDVKVALHHGRIIKLMGDGMLVEFGTVEDAVLCAAEIQRGMRSRNSSIPRECRIELRIGINIGDIMFTSNARSVSLAGTEQLRSFGATTNNGGSLDTSIQGYNLFSE